MAVTLTAENTTATAARPPKRIVYVDHTAKLGGGEIALLHMVQRLDPARFTPIIILSADGPLVEKLRESGIETHILPLSSRVLETRKDSLGINTLLRLTDIVSTLAYTRRLQKLIKTINADLVHTNSLKADIIGGIAARMAGAKLLWHIRDRIDNDYLPKPVVKIFRGLCRVFPDYVVANSQSTLDTVNLPQSKGSAPVYSGIDVASRLRIVHDGIRSSRWSSAICEEKRQEAATQSAPIHVEARIGLVGRIARWKGQHIFLQAAAQVVKKFPDVEFQIIGAPLFGEHDYEAEIKAMTANLGLAKNVQFLGFRDDVPQLVAGLDILVHASISAEPFGQVVVEGMAAGKPLVATKGGGVTEIVLDHETGLLVDMGDADAMAQAILYLLEHREEAHEMGQRGQRRAIDHFSVEITSRRMEQVYEDILGS